MLIVGAGPIGILHVMLARLNGAESITIADRWPERLALAERLGADVTLDVRGRNLAEAARAETGGRGFDVIIVAAPVARGGRGGARPCGAGRAHQLVRRPAEGPTRPPRSTPTSSTTRNCA